MHFMWRDGVSWDTWREVRMIRIILAALLLSLIALAQTTNTPYPKMAPLDEYLIQDRNAEIVLARTAAPKTISDDAVVMVLERQGYKTGS
jgi:hypothetical protein